MIKGSYYKTNENDVIVVVVMGEKPEDDIYFGFYQDVEEPKANYIGWLADENGYNIGLGVPYKITPLFDDKDGYDYEIDVN